MAQVEQHKIILEGQEWVEWAQHHQTRVFLEYLKQTVSEHQQDWLKHHYEDDNLQLWMHKNAIALGYASFCQDIVDDLERLLLPSKHEQKKELSYEE